MIKSLKLKNFRNFLDKHITFDSKKCFIIWKNGKWKTNILEALSILTNNSIIWIEIDKLVLKWKNTFFIEYSDEKWNKLWISYDKKIRRKTYIINTKKIIKKKFIQNTPQSVNFSPIIMNLMYLSPSLRRSFLDKILNNSFPEYESITKKYKKIIKNRNIILKKIREEKIQKNEINFWNTEFIKYAKKIYIYRFKIIEFLQKHINKSNEYFLWKISEISLIYSTKIQKKDIEWSIKNYLEKNFERDIILWNTSIWPHIDDFDILVDNTKLISFASRWEIKSVILWLKLLETSFIEKTTGKKPILLIDDLLSELDDIHKKILINKIKYYQTFITSIELDNKNENIIKL